MENFQLAYLEGLFCQAGPDDYNVVTDGSPNSVAEALAPMIGRKVRVVMHHFPPDLDNMNPKEWGGGCCEWQPNPCPAGHHERPDYLYNQDARGILRRHTTEETPLVRAVSWVVEGWREPVRLDFGKMRRHYGRLAIHTEFDMSEGEIPDERKLARVAEMVSKASAFADVLERLKGKV